MGGISFNPNSGGSGRVQQDVSHAYQKQLSTTDRASERFGSEAGSVSLSQDRYARADAYGKNGQTYQKGTLGPQSASDAKKLAWNSIRPSVVDSKDYGQVIGEPKLSEKAAEYYKQLKSRFGNLDFVLVDKASLKAAKANANSYGNANHMVVLIDEEKLERMATDENFRKKYEAIIQQAANGGSRLSELAKLNPNIKKIGVRTNEDGTTSFIAACAKGNSDIAGRMAKKRAEKKEAAKAAEKKAHKKHDEEVRKEHIDERRKKAEEFREELEKRFNRSVIGDDDFSEYENEDEYEIIEASSIEELISRLEAYNERTGFAVAVPESGSYMDFQA